LDRCDQCKDVFEEDDSDRPVKCGNCGAMICETCEVLRCDEGRHDCPACGAKIARCEPA
jgi:predicted RNA-binding Zn-ribbon protein involved in translation (DUF1610 family)